MQDKLRALLRKYSAEASMDAYELTAIQISDALPNGIPIPISGPDWSFVARKYQWALNTFVYGNGFIGNDYFLLRYSASQLIQYLKVIATEPLTTEQLEACELETEALFYQFIGHIFGIKEKLETFLCWKSKQKRISDTILTTKAANELQAAVLKFYPQIAHYCDARNACIHNTYDLRHLRDRDIFRISCFAFTLSPEHFRKEEESRIRFSLELPATEVEIARVVRIVFETLTDVLRILADLNNVDVNKLCMKFTEVHDHKTIFTITF